MRLLRYLVVFMILAVNSASMVQAQDTAGAIPVDDIEFTDIAEAPADGTGSAVADTDTVKAAKATQTVSAVSAPADKSAEQQSLWLIFIAGFAWGLAAIIMPCIFPMLPLTVSYFTKSADSRRQAVSKAILYGISIIVIYVVFGLLITVIFGADTLNDLSTNGIFNFAFFLLLLVFAASFLGAFEITLPSSWANKLDSKADNKGLSGIFFMAATLALVSFSCTGPLIGTLLVQAASMGALLGPAVGMFGFSLALAIPFAVLAMFPSMLKSLPRSGGWLNSVKVVLGFLELGFALKFLSNVDLAYHWNWFDREVFLSLWIVIAVMMGFYLLGKLKFAHDTELSFISIPRIFLSVIVFAFAIYLVPGLWGAPLTSVSAYLPPQSTQDFDLYTASLSGGGSGQTAKSGSKHKYADLFHAPLGLDAFFDYEEGMAYAKQTGKPVMIDFTGHACVNCRKMETTVWPDKQVFSRLQNDFVLIQLYVDDKGELPAEEQYVSKFSGKKIKTIGNKWSDFQASKFNANSQPFYVLLDHSGKVLVPPVGADYDPASYLKFLDSGLAAFGKK
ncbi:protein-disulfide reductase DsbD family protein [Arcticibacter tournemirensis]|uniref:Thioredoxin family protein n=1 Tax=Arcticibacter tournemirensis TaxID=699437 RepID=A0A4Q0MAK4_9SPHI|nr:thioredoxin family protein [Arcticibacter tournemirensis]RXF70023.1 thioredoxin family protein [Arcticibacter tournemirensis]